jgi:protein gp37
MSASSNIEWTDATWNPVVGCSVVSPGCTNCYAMRLAGSRLAHTMKYRGLTKDSNAGPVWTGEVRLWEKALTDPLHWREPRKIFVNSEGDLFHESIPDEWIDRVFAVMALCPQHTFQLLTKRAERMRDYISMLDDRFHGNPDLMGRTLGQAAVDLTDDPCAAHAIDDMTWPLPNVWLGVSCERQQEADERIPLLLQTPAAIRFISAEPLLGPIDLRNLRDGTFNALDGIDFEAIGDIRDVGDLSKTQRPATLNWVIVGGESGPNARPMRPQWAREFRDKCQAAGVSFFFKQWGEWAPRWPGDRSEGQIMERVGKKADGRLLDGSEHNGFPEARS